MLNVFEIDNPFDLNHDNVKRTEMENGHSPRSICKVLYGPDFKEFEFPTICLVNGEPWKRDRWADPVPWHASVSFVRLSGAVALIIIAIVVVIVAVVVALVVSRTNPAAVGAANKAGQQQNGNSVYTLTGQTNQDRLNSSIECSYGRNRLYPSYAAKPYNLYQGNDQYQYSLFCLGHGTFTMEVLQFADTPLANFRAMEYEIVQPGGTFTLFADNVYTSPSVQGIEMYGANEPSFTGWTPAYVVNLPFTQTNRIDIDVSLPAGLFSIDDTGNINGETIKAKFEIQPVDDYGRPLGPWRRLFFTNRTLGPSDPTVTPKSIYVLDVESGIDIEMQTAVPQRFTYSAEVLPGRYFIHGQRSNNKNMDVNSGNTLRWDGMRAFFPSTKQYGDVTLVAIKARASDILNDNSSIQFNVVCTRNLPTWNPTTGWSKPVPTRNPVWAFCDIFRADYAGRLPDTFLDLQDLYTLSLYYEENSIWFDYIFDSLTTIWEAAKTVAKVGRGVPMLNGSRVYIVRDQPKITPTAVFNAYNIVSGSFQWQLKLPNISDPDGIEIEYVDESTWKQDTVLCLIGADQGNNPEQIKLLGCTNRYRAFQEGLYMRAVELYCRENITFDTGLEGFLPAYGDMILVSHDVPKWGSGGYIKSIADDRITLSLSDTAIFVEGIVHNVLLRKKDGTALGPFQVIPGVDDYTVVSSLPIPDEFYFDGIHEPPYYLFGQQFLESKQCAVVGIVPKDLDIVTIQCVNYDDRLFEFAGISAPTTTAVNPIQLPSLPVVASINVSVIPGTDAFVNVSWPPALGAKSYYLETSTDGATWTRVSTQPSTVYELHVIPQYIFLRVAAVNVGIGPWVQWYGRVGFPAALPTQVINLHIIGFIPGSSTVGWNVLANIDSYQVAIYDQVAGLLLRTEFVTVAQYTYTADMATADGFTGAELTFRLNGKNILGISALATVLNVALLPLVAVDPLTTDDTFLTTDTSTTTDYP